MLVKFICVLMFSLFTLLSDISFSKQLQLTHSTRADVCIVPTCNYYDTAALKILLCDFWKLNVKHLVGYLPQSVIY